MSKFYTVIENGVEKQFPMTPEMEESFKALREWDGWCKCKKPHPDHIHIEMRGHSCDVQCTDCGGWRQIG